MPLYRDEHGSVACARGSAAQVHALLDRLSEIQVIRLARPPNPQGAEPLAHVRTLESTSREAFRRLDPHSVVAPCAFPCLALKNEQPG